MVLLLDETPGPSALAARSGWIEDAYAAPTVAEIIARLKARAEPDAQQAALELESLSPTALTVTLAAIRSARDVPGCPRAGRVARASIRRCGTPARARSRGR
ncbi:enoyl-CoA hydratase/isomerase family protein, partial [Rhizobium johnstonii]|uniref:enoyl-CoA hydratase/isomerase family protein n=1 Tax=Rhizobium johnstonii TaxID=3019933 RepID=UPI003F947E1F